MLLALNPRSYGRARCRKSFSRPGMKLLNPGLTSSELKNKRSGSKDIIEHSSKIEDRRECLYSTASFWILGYVMLKKILYRFSHDHAHQTLKRLWNTLPGYRISIVKIAQAVPTCIHLSRPLSHKYHNGRSSGIPFVYVCS